MEEEAAVMLIMAFCAVLAFAFYQRFWVIRRLRNRLDKFVDAAIAGRPAPAQPQFHPEPADESEMRRIKDRLKVLERIAVEREATLSRQIEDLRATGA